MSIFAPNKVWLSADRRTYLEYDPSSGTLNTYVENVLVSQTPSGVGVGRLVYVDANNGSSGNDGRTQFTPIVSWDTAVGLCTANAGDVIVLMPNHIETITGTIALDVAGVTTIGLGVGDNQPQIRLNLAAATVAVSAVDNVIDNVRFSADVTDVLCAVDVLDAANGFVMRRCRFDPILTGTDEFSVSVRLNDATNGALIENNDFDMGIGGAVAAISFTKDTDSTIVRNNRVMGDYSTACLQGITTLSTKLLIEDNVLINGLSGDLNAKPSIQLLTGSTGVIRNNLCICDVATPGLAIVADACFRDNNRYSEAVAVDATPVTQGQYVPGLGYHVTKLGNIGTSIDDLFLVTGKNLVMMMIGECMSVVATTTSLQLIASVGTRTLTASTDIVTELVNTLYVVTGDQDEPLSGTAQNTVGLAMSVTDLSQPLFVINDNVIQQSVQAAGTGLFEWDIWYIPIEAGASITSMA